MNKANNTGEWVSVEDGLPDKEDYYRVKFDDNSEDEKPFRIRPNKNIHGFMTEKQVTHWMTLPFLPNKEQGIERSVATGDASSNADDKIEKDNYEYERGNE